MIPRLEAVPGWRTPTGIHGEIRVDDSLSDAEVKNLINQRIRKERLPMGSGVIEFLRLEMDGDKRIVVFEVV